LSRAKLRPLYRQRLVILSVFITERILIDVRYDGISLHNRHVERRYSRYNIRYRTSDKSRIRLTRKPQSVCTV